MCAAPTGYRPGMSDDSRDAASAASHEAEQAAAGDDLLDGSVHDAHAEFNQDPDRGGATERHRRQADDVESTNHRAADETLGTSRGDHPRSLRQKPETTDET